MRRLGQMRLKKQKFFGSFFQKRTSSFPCYVFDRRVSKSFLFLFFKKEVLPSSMRDRPGQLPFFVEQYHHEWRQPGDKKKAGRAFPRQQVILAATRLVSPSVSDGQA
jgi:hypothetical protein